jgi:hypothetical protein
MNGDRSRTDATEPVEEIAEEAAADNPDPQTRRETFELDLMDEDRSDEGEDVEVEPVAERLESTAADSAEPRDAGTR